MTTQQTQSKPTPIPTPTPTPAATQQQSTLKALGVKNLAKQNNEKYYKFVVYGRFGTGKTTALTRENNALILDINEDGTTVAQDGAVVEVRDWEHLENVIKYLPQILKELRDNGKQIDIVVIETVQKLRDITMDGIMKGSSKKPTFNDWGAAATKIIHMYRFIGKLQQEHKFHFGITGHEKLNTEKDQDGATINAMVSIEAQDQIKKAIVSQADVLARASVEVTETDGVTTPHYYLSVEPSELYETKIRHSPNVTINNKRFENATVSMLVDAIRNGN
ncbi:AAA family ATPase [Macrococcus sp. S115]|uniref:AAA family ATPase n=1 Tax=Macrococcus sp. S115 TaxID=3047480 RepID=UPI0024BCC969|nr:AAA family ATPase [Macrococcus sp. S115]MDJ1111460.1 AAA family ATPase [Macrococcus sp. S115]